MIPTPKRPLHEPVAVQLSHDEVVEIGDRRMAVRAVAQRMMSAAKGELRLPILPETASEALRLANDPKTPMNVLERVVARDAVLASRMLMVASSAAYAGANVRTLGGALQRMGSGTVRDILYQSVMECHVFGGADHAWARRERDHAVGVGAVARIICKMVGLDSELVFICGLLHDLGRVALRVPDVGELDSQLRHDAELIAHTRLGERIAHEWKLPPLVAEAMRRHHGYRGFGNRNDGYSQIGHIIAAADLICTHLGQGRVPHPLDSQCMETLCSLGLDPPRLVGSAREILSVAA